MKRPSVGRMTAACIIALVLGFAQPFTLMLSMAVMVTPILLTVLYFWAGSFPAILGAIASMASIELIFGKGAMWGSFAALLLPTFVAIYLLRSRRGFFSAMRTMCCVQAGAVLLVIGYLYVSQHMGLVELLIEALRKAIDQLPVVMQDQLLNQFGMFGLLEADMAELLKAGTMDLASRTRAFEQVFYKLDYMFKLVLPGMVLSSSILTGILTIALPTRICVRRGDEPQYSYVPLTEWFLPGRVTAGLLVTLGTCIVLQATNISGADATTAAVTTVVYLFFAAQGAAALDRALKHRGWRQGGRVAMVVAIALLDMSLLQWIGAASALLGRRGLVTTWLKKRQEQHNKED